jgi:hypothetical protein
MALSTYSANSILGWIKGVTFPVAPTNLFFSLHSADSKNGANEVTNTFASGRVSYTAADFSVVSQVAAFRQISSTIAVDWGASILAGSVSHFGIWDAITGGNCLFVGDCRTALGVANPLTFGLGDNISLPISAVIIQIANSAFSNYFVDAFLEWVKGTTFPSAPTDLYTGLATAILPDGTTTEVTTTIAPSGRIAIASTLWTAIATVGNYRQTRNTNNASFGTSAGAVTGLDFVTIWDASSAGNLIAYGAIPSQNIAVGQSVLIAANAITLGIN